MSKFGNDKRVVVTGGSGFLGSFVVEKLCQRNAKDIFVPRKAEFDLREPDAIQRLLEQAKPNIVIHLAASVGGIGANREHPADFFYDNLMMGTQLLHECWRANISKLVIIGTLCAYPKFTPVPFKEDDLWNGYPEETNAPYSIAKKALLVQSEAYRQQYGFNSIFLLPTNLYGPRDNFDPKSSRVIPAFIRKCLEAKEIDAPYIEPWGDGSPTREFLYVEDAAEGIIVASEHYNSSEPVNLGSSSEISIRDLTELIAKLTGFEGEIRWDTTKPNGQPRRKLDVTKAKQMRRILVTLNSTTWKIQFLAIRRLIQVSAGISLDGRGATLNCLLLARGLADRYKQTVIGTVLSTDYVPVGVRAESGWA